MPFKEDVIALVDSMDDSALAINSVNTLVNTDGHLRAYNTDYVAVVSLLRDHGVDPGSTFAVLGSGGMARAVVAALRDSGFAAGGRGGAQRGHGSSAGRGVRVSVAPRGRIRSPARW